MIGMPRGILAMLSQKSTWIKNTGLGKMRRLGVGWGLKPGYWVGI